MQTLLKRILKSAKHGMDGWMSAGLSVGPVLETGRDMGMKWEPFKFVFSKIPYQYFSFSKKRFSHTQNLMNLSTISLTYKNDSLNVCRVPFLWLNDGIIIIRALQNTQDQKAGNYYRLSPKPNPNNPNWMNTTNLWPVMIRRTYNEY